MGQITIRIEGSYAELDALLRRERVRALLVVCGPSFFRLPVAEHLGGLEERLGIRTVYFHGFSPNPRCESVAAGVTALRREKCDAVLAVGGGSAMDVAKGIKRYACADLEGGFLRQQVAPNSVKLFALPTTAGSGSEATRYAVLYEKGEKRSVEDAGCIPSAVVLDPSALRSLPEYQRKASMLDALCHAVESCWSLRSTKESRADSLEVIREIRRWEAAYLANRDEGNAGMLCAANRAGRAIDQAQTTAGHAMSYKLTGLYGIAHGHAAALCVAELWPDMLEHRERWRDPRGAAHLRAVLEELARAAGGERVEDGAAWFRRFLGELRLEAPSPEEKDYAVLARGVNPERLRNHPVRLDVGTLERLYRRALGPKDSGAGEDEGCRQGKKEE